MRSDSMAALVFLVESVDGGNWLKGVTEGKAEVVVGKPDIITEADAFVVPCDVFGRLKGYYRRRFGDLIGDRIREATKRLGNKVEGTEYYILEDGRAYVIATGAADVKYLILYATEILEYDPMQVDGDSLIQGLESALHLARSNPKINSAVIDLTGLTVEGGALESYGVIALTEKSSCVGSIWTCV